VCVRVCVGGGGGAAQAQAPAGSQGLVPTCLAAAGRVVWLHAAGKHSGAHGGVSAAPPPTGVGAAEAGCAARGAAQGQRHTKVGQAGAMVGGEQHVAAGRKEGSSGRSMRGCRRSFVWE
jgi:hypothetical protein